MAIFGNLTDIPFSDIFPLATCRGLSRLSITHHQTGNVYELTFLDGNAISLSVDNIPLPNVLSVMGSLGVLAQARDADFIIERQLRENGMVHFDFLLPANQLLASVLALVDEMMSLRNHLPNEKTKFISPNPHEIWLGDELSQFFELCHVLLARGASGEELAVHTGISLENVLLNLYKLRATGVIQPLRAAPACSPRKEVKQEEPPRAELVFFQNAQKLQRVKEVPHISFEPVVSDDERCLPPPKETVCIERLPQTVTLVSEAGAPTAAVYTRPSSADLGHVHIVQPPQSLTKRIMGRLASLCR